MCKSPVCIFVTAFILTLLTYAIIMALPAHSIEIHRVIGYMEYKDRILDALGALI